MSVCLNQKSQELEALRQSLAESTVRGIKVIARGCHELSQKYSENASCIEKGIWYPFFFLEACNHHNPRILKYVKDNKWQLKGYMPAQFFDRIPDNNVPLKCRVWEFLAKPDVLPSDALKAAIQGLSIIDCGMACQLARYIALLEVLKEDKFNRLFGRQVGQLMNIGHRTYDELQPMRYFVDFTKAADSIEEGVMGNRPVKEGELCGFEGVPEYELKYPYMGWQTVNVICINAKPGEQRFVGLGIPPEGETEVELCNRLLDKYNKEENYALFAPKELPIEFVQMWAKLHPQKATEVGGYHPGTSEGFLVEVIRDLVKLPLEKVSMDFVKNHPANINRYKKKGI